MDCSGKFNSALFVLSNFSYPPKEGAHEQTVKTISSLVASGVNVSLIIFTKSKEDLDENKILINIPGVSIIYTLEKNIPYSALMSYRYIASMLGFTINFDRRLIDHINSSRYCSIVLEGMPLAPLIKKIKCKNIILSPIDAWSLRQKRLGSIEQNIIKRVAHILFHFISKTIEKKLFPKFKAIHVVSTEDAKYLAKVSKLSNIATIPIQFKIGEKNSLKSTEKTISILGDLSVPFIYNGFVEFVKKTLPSIEKTHSCINYNFFCRTKPDEKLRALCEKYKNINFIPWCKDLEKEMTQSYAVLLLDSGGTGLKNRAIHALSTSTPLIASEPAAEGINLISGKNGLIFRTNEECAAHVINLAENKPLRKMLSEEGFKLWQENFSDTSVSKKWLALILNENE